MTQSDQSNCDRAGKRRFPSQAKARRSAIRGQLPGYWRAYRCPFCMGWHLTHQRPGEGRWAA